jgi:hypothetical protein
MMETALWSTGNLPKKKKRRRRSMKRRSGRDGTRYLSSGGGGGVGGVGADWQQLTESDIVHTIDASHLIKHHLEKVQSENGGPDHFRDTWVVNVDRDVLSEFAKLGLV